MYVPPQKVASKILEPYDVLSTFSKNRRLKVGPNRGAKSQFGITRHTCSGGPPGPPGKSSLKLHGGRRPPKNFFTRVPPMLIFTQVARRRRAKNFYKGPPYVIFSSYKNLKVSTQVTRNFELDRGGGPSYKILGIYWGGVYTAGF